MGFWIHDFSSVLLYILLYLREQWLFSLLAGSFTAVFDDGSEGFLGVRYLGCVFVSGPHQGRTYFLTSSSRDQKRFRARYMELSSFFFRTAIAMNTIFYPPNTLLLCHVIL